MWMAILKDADGYDNQRFENDKKAPNSFICSDLHLRETLGAKYISCLSV